MIAEQIRHAAAVLIVNGAEAPVRVLMPRSQFNEYLKELGIDRNGIIPAKLDRSGALLPYLNGALVDVFD